MLTAAIIDDESFCIDDLNYLITKHQLPVSVVATAGSGTEGIEIIKKHKPQLVFLDVVMPGMSGFEMLAELPSIDFNLIVTTAIDTYAIQAIRASAIDFLVKPVKSEELSNAITRLLQKQAAPEMQQLKLLHEQLQQKNRISKIALTISNGVQLVRIDDILYFKSDGNYTTVYLKNAQEILVSRQIGKFEETLLNESFFRIHSSYLINLNYVNRYLRGDGGYVVMENGDSITIARNRKDDFLKLIGKS